MLYNTTVDSHKTHTSTKLVLQNAASHNTLWIAMLQVVLNFMPSGYTTLSYSYFTWLQVQVQALPIVSLTQHGSTQPW